MARLSLHGPKASDKELSGASGHQKFDNHEKNELRKRLNLIAVAETHILWKTRLGHHVEGNTRESLDETPLGQDGICQLGRWINSSILEPFCEPEICRQLSEAHQQFHEFGLLIIERLNVVDRKGAAEMF